MTEGNSREETHFLNEPENESADEFLQRRLEFIEEHFAYERLCGLSKDGLREELDTYQAMLTVTKNRFSNFKYSDDPLLYAVWAENMDEQFEPLTAEQENQIEVTDSIVHRNFDKAIEDAKNRRFERISNLLSSIPGVGRN
ncbi:hypothetical protein [Haloarcula argentinensis]|uniref:Uncharacterized protein n=1 Tax=Haloarcula argentinensis TaxID=43776 RepID=A0ABU2EW82_HALAR|nr:hypothetical protein [Haloarcula argentinensis]MDS0252534.1 hypothetical protein [Haloarcula argentinensis]